LSDPDGDERAHILWFFPNSHSSILAKKNKSGMMASMLENNESEID
jgi:hypothetical protein